MQELRKIDVALRAWSGEEVEDEDCGTLDAIQDAINMIWASISFSPGDQATTDIQDAEIKALRAENFKLLKDRICLKDGLMGYKLAAEEQEDEVLAFRLQHEEDAQEKTELLQQVEDCKELEATKPRRDRRHRAPVGGDGGSVRQRTRGNQEGAR